MRKLFLKSVTLLFLLMMSVNAVWAQEAETPEGQTVYLAAFKAQTSSESTGSGKVKLTWIDAIGELFANPLTLSLNNNPNLPYATGNPSNGDKFADDAMVIGATLTATESVEDSNPNSLVNKLLRGMLAGSQDVPNLFMTPFAYFKADAEGNEGSYFSEWKFNDVKVTRQDTAMDKTHPESAYYKVLPNSANVCYMVDPTSPMTKFEEAYAGAIGAPNTIYAVFKKFLLSNPVVKNNGSVGTTEGSSTKIYISVDVEGDVSQLKNKYADFAEESWSIESAENEQGTWSCIRRETNPIETISSTKKRFHYVVTYTAKSAITPGSHRATLIIKMKGDKPSTLNIPLTVLARPVSAKEASVRIGDADPVEYATLAQAVTVANDAAGDVVLTLLKDIAVSSTVTLTNTMTLDLNGYTLSAATVGMSAIPGMIGSPVLIIDAAGKTVNVAYNKQGGAIMAAPGVDLGNFGIKIADGLGVEVKAGTFVLNGGTVASVNEINDYKYNTGTATIPIQTAAIKVDAGAKLIQNGATITATSAGPNAIGIYNEGTVQIKNGSISAEAGFNNAMAVYALNGSSTTIDGGSLSALAKEQDGTTTFKADIPNGIPTWTNAYAVNVAEGSTVTVNGGDLYAEATNANRAYAVSALAGFGGKLTINKGATVRAKSPNNMYSFPVALMAGDVTINGGKFDGKYMDNTTGETNNPAVFGVDYSKFTFVSGTCMTEMFFTEDGRFPTSVSHPKYKNYSVVKGSQDYSEGYRYIAVANDAELTGVVPACRIGSMGYNTLEDAIAYANNHPSEEVVIFMLRDYTLPAGYYTLPAKATLVVPMSDEQAKEINYQAPRITFNDVNDTHPYSENIPTEYRHLTFASGVHMDVHGDIEVTCTQLASNESYTSQPFGPYGRLILAPESYITLQDGSELRAWGFVTGDGSIDEKGIYLSGEIDARRGATVREMFQLGDWKGAMTSVAITGLMGDEETANKKIFPVTQYFIQNIESPVKYHPGAVLSTSAAVSEGLLGSVSVTMCAPDIKIVDVSQEDGKNAAIFLMDAKADAENTWVRKWYDVKNDVQTYEVNSGAHIGSMVLDMGRITLAGYDVPVRLNSAKFDLPITNNFKIHLLSGTMDFLQNTSLLPGAEVEVDKESIVSVEMSKTEKTAYDAWVAGGKVGDAPVSYTGALYVYDADEWDTYAFCGSANAPEDGAYTKVVRYAPSWDDKGAEFGRPNLRSEYDKSKLKDAAINVHGTFKTKAGFVYTSAGGANIFSSNKDAGNFVFNKSVSDAENPRLVYNVKGVNSYEDLYFYPAKLKNGVADPAYANTSEAEAGDAYCYQNDKWDTMIVDPDNPCFMVKQNENGDTYYAKPQEYVAVVATKTLNQGEDPNSNEDDYYEILGNADHTYSDADGAGRLFILMDEGCQWWEVEKKDNLYHCIHPNNDTYYYWNDEYGSWQEKRCTITWKNYNGDTIQTKNADEQWVGSYSVPYGTIATFLGSNPTHPEDVDYTYDFIGWSPALGKVTSDVTYMASFEQKPRMYTIIFQNEGEVEIERHFLTRNEIPVCKNVPTKVGHHLIWSPAISKVIGDQTYIATWEENLPTEWNVNFVNNAQGELQAATVVSVNNHPTYSGKTPEKENADHTPYTSDEYTYTFWGWSAVIDGVEHQFAARDELPSPTAPTTYTAVYTQAAKTYSVNFITYKGNVDNDNHVIASESYTYGATPIAPAADKVRDKIALGTTPNYKFNDEKYTYSFAWNPQIQTVIKSQDYVAVIDSVINRYTVTLKSNPSGACTFTGAGTFEYNEASDAVTIGFTANPGYKFTGWSDESTESSRSMALTGDINLVANFEYEGEATTYTINWNEEDGTLIKSVAQVEGTATTYTGATPTKAATTQNTFTFDGWTTAANGAGTYYKNGMTPRANANASYFAHFAATPIPNLNVNSVSGPTVLSEPVTYHDLVITSNGVTSAQLIGVDYLNLTGNAYFDLAINAKDHKWYAIAVPWDVDPTDGVSVGGRTLKFGKEFDILYYDGATRASEGTTGNAWKYLETDPIEDGLLKPGKLYMIGLTHEAPVIRFKKKDKSPLLNIYTSVTAHAQTTGNEKDANWNGIANPALFNAYVNAGVTVGQVYNASTNSYSTINLDSKKLVLGQPVFVQVPAAKSIQVTYGGAYAAPRRANAMTEETTDYEIRIASAGADYTDRLFIRTDADKVNDKYIIGSDLAKMGISSVVAQMWVNRYDTKLCLNTMALSNGTAEYPLGIYVPEDGEYTITNQISGISNQTSDIYLTKNGEAIANLSDGAYTLNLQKGTTNIYGLRIGARVPQVATDLDAAIVDADGKTTKVLYHGQVFIIRGEKVYTVDGQLVK